MKTIVLPILAALAMAAQTNSDPPQFTPDGQLVLPKDYREWVYLSSGLGMTHGPAAQADRRASLAIEFRHKKALVMTQRDWLGDDQTLQIIEASWFIRSNDQIPDAPSEMSTRGEQHHPGEKVGIIGIRTSDINRYLRPYAGRSERSSESRNSSTTGVA